MFLIFHVALTCFCFVCVIYWVYFVFNFWATVCKTVRPVLSVRCLSVLSVSPVYLSVTLVYCGQTVGRIRMKLSMEVGLGPCHIVLDGDPATPSPKGVQPPSFRPMSVVAKQLHRSRCHLARRLSLIHIWRCRRSYACRSRWSPYH